MWCPWGVETVKSHNVQMISFGFFRNKSRKHAFTPLSSGSYPSPKAGATLVMHKDLLVLFGGWTRPSPYPLHQPERFFDEIHTYSPSKNWWELADVAFSLSCESFSFPTLWFLLTRLFLSKVELHSNDTWTSSHGRPFFFCHRKHHGGVRRILRSAANVRSSYVIAQFPKVGGMSEKSPLYTNKYTQTQILFRNLSKSALASTSPPPDGMVVAQVSHRLP